MENDGRIESEEKKRRKQAKNKNSNRRNIETAG